jgi:hypothetical protein
MPTDNFDDRRDETADDRFDDRRDDDPEDDRPRRRRDRDDPPDYERHHRGGLILAFGIISLVAVFLCPMIGIVLGILAWIWGNSDLRGIEGGEVDPEGRSLIQAGRICGIIGTVLNLLYFLFLVVYLIFIFVFIAAMPPPAPPPQNAPVGVPAPQQPPPQGW